MEKLGANASTLQGVNEAMSKPGFGRGSFIADANFVNRQGGLHAFEHTYLMLIRYVGEHLTI